MKFTLAQVFGVAQRNKAFRRVVLTNARTQLVVMNIPPGDSVGMERHAHVEQTLMFLSGAGIAELNGKKSRVRSGDVVVVPPGTRHNFTNAGRSPLRIVTIYAPPNHIAGRVQMTHADADADVADEAFGKRVR